MLSLVQYLPSGQFVSIASSIAVGGALILGAQYITAPKDPPELSAQTNVEETDDWQSELDLIQAASPGLPELPDEGEVQELLTAAKSSNLTDSVARTLLVSLTSASSQGLGADLPTQERLIAEATAQLDALAPEKTYTAADLKTAGSGQAELKTYGNTVMEVLDRHTGATSQATLKAVSELIDTGSAQKLAELSAVQAEYEALAADLSRVVVPGTLVALHLQAVNAVGLVAASFEDLKVMAKDPLRGLGGLQRYQLKLGEVGRVFTAIAGIFSKNGILFNKDEPGEAWNVFLPS